jgi:hypothetical protein
MPLIILHLQVFNSKPSHYFHLYFVQNEGRQAFKSVLVQAQSTAIHNEFICIILSKYSCVSAIAKNLEAVKLGHGTVIHVGWKA